MPIYVYECSQCSKVFEVEQRIIEDALTDCDCGGTGSLKRLIQPTAVMFKGSGFYVNDKAGTGSSASVPEGDAKAEVKSETPAAAAPTETPTSE